ncbi:hypothetical protein WJX84_002989 [Apatococcus fuscideae]|uniref:Uncharacterized protein n=1 Tax=Apatococcus fuscideae TaxID=2026836 RepID=A0AAW1SY43_9CHLO
MTCNSRRPLHPATLEYSPGTKVAVYVTFLTPDLLERMDATEGAYFLCELFNINLRLGISLQDFGLGKQAPESLKFIFQYNHQHGTPHFPILLDGQAAATSPIAIQEIPAADRRETEHSTPSTRLMIKKSSTGSGPKVDLRKGTGCGMQTKSAFGEDRASSSSKKVYAPAGTARVLPDDLTITIGLLIKNSYESEIAELEAELQELREASIPDVQTALWEELDTAEEAETPFKVTKALLAEKEDWLTLEMLFDDWMLAQLGPRMKEAVIYEHLVKELADNPRDFMEEFFRYYPSDTEDEEDDF